MAAYSITLTTPELDTFLWAANHGYDAGMLDASSGIPDPNPDGTYTIEFEEHKAWLVMDAYNEDPHAFCAGGSVTGDLARKMVDFVNGIV